jgi:hypothetical protein
MDESTLIVGLILLVVGLVELWLVNRSVTPPEHLDKETRRWLNSGKG